MSIYTMRLNLRSWHHQDIEKLYAMYQDPRLLELLPEPMSEQSVEHFVHTANDHLKKHGFTFWAVELLSNRELIGFVGLHSLKNWHVPFTPAIEIAWRLHPDYWGQGYATEGARAAITFGFNECRLAEVVSFTVPGNLSAQRVMQKIGLERDYGGDFKHPDLPENHRFSQQVLYRKSKKYP